MEVLVDFKVDNMILIMQLEDMMITLGHMEVMAEMEEIIMEVEEGMEEGEEEEEEVGMEEGEEEEEVGMEEVSIIKEVIHTMKVVIKEEVVVVVVRVGEVGVASNTNTVTITEILCIHVLYM